MTAFLILDSSSEAVSLGTVVADPLPAGLTAMPLTDDEYAAIQAGTLVWDAAKRALIAVVAPDAPASPDLAGIEALIDGATSLAKARDAMRAIVAAITP